MSVDGSNPYYGFILRVVIERAKEGAVKVLDIYHSGTGIAMSEIEDLANEGYIEITLHEPNAIIADARNSVRITAKAVAALEKRLV